MRKIDAFDVVLPRAPWENEMTDLELSRTNTRHRQKHQDDSDPAWYHHDQHHSGRRVQPSDGEMDANAFLCE